MAQSLVVAPRLHALAAFKDRPDRRPSYIPVRLMDAAMRPPSPPPSTRRLLDQVSHDLVVRNVVGGISVPEPFAQDRDISLVFKALQKFGIRHGDRSHDTLALAREHDPLVAVGNAFDVFDEAPLHLPGRHLSYSPRAVSAGQTCCSAQRTTASAVSTAAR